MSRNHDKVKEVTDTSAKLKVETIDIDGEAIEIKQLITSLNLNSSFKACRRNKK